MGDCECLLERMCFISYGVHLRMDKSKTPVQN